MCGFLVAYVSCFAWLLLEGVMVVVCFGSAVKTNVILILNIWLEFPCKNISTIYISILLELNLFLFPTCPKKKYQQTSELLKSEHKKERIVKNGDNLQAE